MLHVEREGAVVIWTIDRPAAKNALDHATLHALMDAVQEAGGDRTARAAVLTGAGHTFVSGGDLRELRHKNTPQDAERFSELGFELCRTMAELPFPIVCALPGPAIGGGAELALACDLRVADVRARIAFKQVRMGVTTAWGTVPRLVAAVGAGVAARLLYAAHEVGAAEAKLIGLVDEVTENGLARTTALAWASDIAQGSPKAIADMKRLVRESTARDVRALERQLFIDTWSGADHHEAVEAYFERRAPVWGDR
ncbi:MAG TPA: enoyl-CoA hydratase/isomerase family protein [Labilithrix sp.]|nr:enoyl-CoA hydratase/isomerase family protein [Labilithrix sp.]